MSTAPSLEGPPRNVLLVEDNPGDARLVQERLKCGWTRNVSVTHVTRLDEGAAHLAAHGADCVLLDLSLPRNELRHQHQPPGGFERRPQQAFACSIRPPICAGGLPR